MVWRAGGEWETLVMRPNDTNLRRACETKFQTEIKSKLNQLWQIEVMAQGLNVLLVTFRHTYPRHPHILGQFYIVTEVVPMFEATENDKYFKFLELKYNHCVIRVTLFEIQDQLREQNILNYFRYIYLSQTF